MTKEALNGTSEVLNPYTIKRLQPEHYTQWRSLAASAWKGVDEVNKPWDFTALTKDNLCSVGIFDGERMLGASLNVLKVGEVGQYLLVHQLGIQVDYQNRGLGKQLMDANFATCRELGIPTVRLTSDPLDSRNMRLYFHKSRMAASEYLPDAYQNLSKNGAEKHRGLPSDRLYFACHPVSPWVEEGLIPSQKHYQELALSHPELLYSQTGNGVVFVETPVNLEQILETDLDAALQLRIKQGDALKTLFDQGYTAVDHAILNNGKHHVIVCLRNFDATNPRCLLDAVNKSIQEKQ